MNGLLLNSLANFRGRTSLSQMSTPGQSIVALVREKMGVVKGQGHIKNKVVPTGSLSHSQRKGVVVPRRKAEGRVV